MWSDVCFHVKEWIEQPSCNEILTFENFQKSLKENQHLSAKIRSPRDHDFDRMMLEAQEDWLKKMHQIGSVSIFWGLMIHAKPFSYMLYICIYLIIFVYICIYTLIIHHFSEILDFLRGITEFYFMN